jgi:hypothetical protein
MQKRIQFNTGRRYTAQGQRIVAVLHDDNVVTFRDHDRMIAGEYTSYFPEDFCAKEVLDIYDCNAYHMSSRALGPGHEWKEN